MPPILGEEARAAFDKEARGLPIEEGEAAPAAEPAAEAGETPVTPHEAEPSGATEPEAASGAGENPPAGEREPQHIPYNRFKEVNDRLKDALSRQAEHEKLLADMDATAKARTADYLRKVAENNPEIAHYIFGEGTEPVEQQTAPANPDPAAPAGGAAPAKPAGQDPLIRHIEQLDKRLKLQEQHRVRIERDQAVQQLQTSIETEMQRFPIFKDQTIGAMAQKLVGREILTNPAVPVAKVVEQVAGQVKAFEESLKAKYVGKKTTAARTIPAGVGTGGAAPPGRQVQKASLTDGSTKKQFAAGLKQLEAELAG